MLPINSVIEHSPTIARRLMAPVSNTFKGVAGAKGLRNLEADTFEKASKKIVETLVPADSKLFTWATKKPELSLTDIKPDSMVFVHRTNYFPKNGEILSTSAASKGADGVGEYRPTIHFSLNKSVTEHMAGNDWDAMTYSIILPFKETVQSMPKSKVIGGLKEDFFFTDRVKLPKGSVILKHSSEIPKGQFKITEPFDGVRLVETSSDDMVGATDTVIRKMGYTPYNTAMQKSLGASSADMEMLSSMPESEMTATFGKMMKDISTQRQLIKEQLESVDELKGFLPDEQIKASKDGLLQALKSCDMAEKYNGKFQDFSKHWTDFCQNSGYYSGLHTGTPWAVSERIFGAIDFMAKGNKKSWTRGDVDFKEKILTKLEDCKTKANGKDLGYDTDELISIIENNKTPEGANKEITKKLKLKSLKPADRTAQFKKAGLSDAEIAELMKSDTVMPDEFVLSGMLDIL